MFTITTGVYNTSSYKVVKTYKTKRGVINYIKQMRPTTDAEYWFTNREFNAGGKKYQIKDF